MNTITPSGAGISMYGKSQDGPFRLVEEEDGEGNAGSKVQRHDPGSRSHRLPVKRKRVDQRISHAVEELIPARRLEHLLRTLDKPDLVILVTGSTEDAGIKPQFAQLLRRGIMGVAHCSAVWLITESTGEGQGVSRVVQAAAEDSALAFPQQKKTVVFDFVSRDVDSARNTKRIEIDPSLEQTPTGRLAIYRIFDTESTTEETLSRFTDGKDLPLAHLVFGGSVEALTWLVQNLEDSKQWPIIVADGSGGVADILGYAYKNSTAEKKKQSKGAKRLHRQYSVMENEVEEEIKQLICEKLESSSTDADYYIGCVRTVLRKRDYISVITIDGATQTPDIRNTILQTVLQVYGYGKTTESMMGLLKLAFEWDQLAYARTEISWDCPVWQRRAKEGMWLVMRDALQKNKPGFIQLLVENGTFIDFSVEREQDKIIELYRKIDKAELLHDLIQRQIGDQELDSVTEVDIERLLKKLMGPSYDPEQWPRTAKGDGPVTSGNRRPSLQLQDKYILRQLFIWNILMNRRESALVFWALLDDCMMMSLFAFKLLQEMSKYAFGGDKKNSLTETAAFFEDLAVAILTQCFERDREKTHRFLIREIPFFYKTTIINLAVEADSKKFIAHTACQSLLTKVWNGNIRHDNYDIVLWAAPLMFFLIPTRLVKLHGELQQRQMKRKELAGKTSTENKSPTCCERLRKEWRGFKTMEWYPKFYNSPIIRFRSNCLSLLIFLTLYSILMLADFQETATPIEYVVIGYVVTLLIEEIRQIASSDRRNKIASHMSDPWNIVDIFTIVVFFIGEILRFIPNDICFISARVILSLCLMAFCFRLLHMFSVHRELGPKLVMIGRMMVDMRYLMVILIVFVVAYGMAVQAILYPNSELGLALLRDVLEKAYFQIYGELFLEEVKGEEECSKKESLWGNNTLPRCPTREGKIFVPILMGFYILVTNVLMLNLLIAMFSYTFEEVQQNTDAVWKSQRLYVVQEFIRRPSQPPPFILIGHLHALFRIMCGRGHENNKSEEELKQKFSEDEENKLKTWEKLIAEGSYMDHVTADREPLEKRLQVLHSKIDSLASCLEMNAMNTPNIRNTIADGHVSPQVHGRSHSTYADGRDF